MKSFIKATEIWEPNRERTALTLVSGIYGKYEKFEDISQTLSFKFGEGLPGKAWALQHPIILKDLQEDYFKRSEIAKEYGLIAAIALPIFCGEYLHAVVVFFCADDEYQSGAIELWKADKDRINEVGLVDGYYGSMEDFEWVSKSIKIMKGQGLPGSVWKKSMPVLINDLGDSATFLRANKAKKEGITVGLAFPTWMFEEDGYIMAFLSAKGTPIARRFEIWIPDYLEKTLYFKDGYSDDGEILRETYKYVTIPYDNSTVGMIWKNGHPILTKSYDTIKTNDHYEALLAIPILQNGFFKAAVLFYL